MKSLGPQTFVPHSIASPLQRAPAGPSLLLVLAAQAAMFRLGPTALIALYIALSAGCIVAKRPVHLILLRAWPLLLLITLTAWRRSASVASAHELSTVGASLLVVARFCWVLLVADLYISAFAWQSMLARMSTGKGFLATGCLMLWLALLHLPEIALVIDDRRRAASARGLKPHQVLTPAFLTAIAVELIDRADRRAEALTARGIRQM